MNFSPSRRQEAVQSANDTLVSSLQQLIDGEPPQQLLANILQYDPSKVIEYAGILEVSPIALLNYIATLLYQENHGDATLTYLQEAYKLDPENEDMLFNYGYTLFQCGELKLALSMLESIKDRNEEAAQLHLEISERLRESNADNSKQIVLFLRRIEQEVNASAGIEEILGRLQSGRLSVDELAAATRAGIIDKARVLTVVSVYCFNQGLYDVVIPIFQQALAFEPCNSFALFHFAMILEELGECETALIYLNQIEEYNEEVEELKKRLRG